MALVFLLNTQFLIILKDAGIFIQIEIFNNIEWRWYFNQIANFNNIKGLGYFYSTRNL